MKTFWLAAVSLCVLASPVIAQPAVQSPTGNLERLGAFQSTGTEEPKAIPQEGRKADALRRNRRTGSDRRGPAARHLVRPGRSIVADTSLTVRLARGPNS